MARVQIITGKTENSASDVVITFAASVTAGNLIEVSVVFYTNNSTGTITVADDKNTSYSQVDTYATQTTFRVAKFYVANTASGTTTITVHPNQSGTYLRVTAVEYDGLATSSPLVSSSKGNATSTTPATGLVTINAPGDLVTATFGFAAYSAGAIANDTLGMLAFITTNGVSLYTCDTSATANRNNKIDTASAVWAAIGACYKLTSYPSSGGGGFKSPATMDGGFQ